MLQTLAELTFWNFSVFAIIVPLFEKYSEMLLNSVISLITISQQANILYKWLMGLNHKFALLLYCKIREIVFIIVCFLCHTKNK